MRRVTTGWQLGPDNGAATRRPNEVLRCIYCTGRGAASDEHIWPRALGGDACPQGVFRTKQVCQNCNTTIGQWVDGAFCKSCFIQHQVGASELQYLDPAVPGILRPIYMGFDTEIPLNSGLVCERWLGAAGDHIYHIHEKDDDRWVVFAGGDFIKRRHDAGRVYVVFTSHDVYWARTTLGSVKKFFPKAKLRSLTKFVGMETRGFLAPDEQLTAAEAAEVEFIYARPDRQLQHLPVQFDFADRFLAKLGLGLGHTVLGPAVSASPYSDRLRNLLWSRDADTRDQLGVKGSGYWDARDPAILKLLNWPGAWCLVMAAMREGFALNVCTPGGRLMTMNASDDPSLWPTDTVAKYYPGLVYIILPQRSAVFGPIPVMQFIAHRTGSWRHPDLAKLDALKIDPAKLPPMRRDVAAASVT
jgi:HNH endonuclease